MSGERTCKAMLARAKSCERASTASEIRSQCGSNEDYRNRDTGCGIVWTDPPRCECIALAPPRGPTHNPAPTSGYPLVALAIIVAIALIAMTRRP